MKNLLLALVLLLPQLTVAQTTEPVTTVIFEWEWPATRCDGTTIALTDIDQAEIYIATDPIPSASEASGEGPCGSTEDVPPPGAILETVTTDATTAPVDLPRGATYFVRMRVQVNGLWSNLSAQVEVDVAHARPNIPIIIRLTS